MWWAPTGSCSALERAGGEPWVNAGGGSDETNSHLVSSRSRIEIAHLSRDRHSLLNACTVIEIAVDTVGPDRPARRPARRSTDLSPASPAYPLLSYSHPFPNYESGRACRLARATTSPHLPTYQLFINSRPRTVLHPCLPNPFDLPIDFAPSRMRRSPTVLMQMICEEFATLARVAHWP